MELEEKKIDEEDTKGERKGKEDIASAVRSNLTT